MISLKLLLFRAEKEFVYARRHIPSLHVTKKLYSARRDVMMWRITLHRRKKNKFYKYVTSEEEINIDIEFVIKYFKRS